MRSAALASLLIAIIAPAGVAAQEAEAPLVVTPEQAEGPFYPVEIPADHDDDLTVVEGAAEPALGTRLELSGRLLRSDGSVVEGATVEIWQTDHQGIYLHPEDPGFPSLDPGFQGYGEAVTDADGRWSFRTILPNVYGNRPRHIHAKVRLGDDELLTTQIYFVDTGVGLEGSVALTDSDLDALITELVPLTGDDTTDAVAAEHEIVLP